MLGFCGIGLCQQMPLNCLGYLLKSFHRPFAKLTPGRRNHGDASGPRVSSHGSKAEELEELQQQHRHKVHWQQDHRPGLRSGHTGERKEPRSRFFGVRRVVDRDRGLALGALPENQTLSCGVGWGCCRPRQPQFHC